MRASSRSICDSAINSAMDEVNAINRTPLRPPLRGLGEIERGPKRIAANIRELTHR